MSYQKGQDQRNWWLGLADLLAQGAGHGAIKLERVHLAIADESFGVLERVTVTRPWARVVRRSHHGISRLCYGAIRVSANSLGYAVSTLSVNASVSLDQDQETSAQGTLD